MYFFNNRPVAIIDSGIGGISVLKQLIAKFGGGNYIYYADNLYMPYGNKSKRFIIKRLDYLINKLQAKYNTIQIIIACNTASTSIDVSKYKNVSVMQFNKNYVYYATELTKKNLKDINVIADKTLPKLIENNIFNKKALTINIRNHINKYNLNKLNSFVLGCTHYELVTNIFKQYCKNTNIICNSKFIVNNIKLNQTNNTNIILLMSKYSKKFSNKFFKIIKE